MNTDEIFRIGQTDLSDYIEEEELSVRYLPVYDDSCSFTAIDGSINRQLLGYRAIVSVILEEIPDETMCSLKNMLESENVSIYIHNQLESDAVITSAVFQPVRTYTETELWSISLCLETDVLFRDGL